MRRQGLRAACSRLEPSSSVSSQGMSRQSPVCQGVKVLSPDIFAIKQKHKRPQASKTETTPQATYGGLPRYHDTNAQKTSHHPRPMFSSGGYSRQRGERYHKATRLLVKTCRRVHFQSHPCRLRHSSLVGCAISSPV